MDWSQFLTLFAANAGLIFWFRFWFRYESRNDWRHMDNQVNAIRQDMKAFHLAMLEETKDFHGRLCSIEERNRK